MAELKRRLLLCALICAGSPSLHAAEPLVDVDLLEFLGSIDSEEEGWHEYLEQQPMGVAGKPVEKAAPKPVAKAPPPPQPPAKTDDKQVKQK